MKHTDDELREAVKKSISVTGVMHALGYENFYPRQHTLVSCRIKELKLDISHFKTGVNKNNTKSPDGVMKSYQRRNLLIKAGVSYKCSNCNISKWCNKEIRLQVDHIDGDRFNDELSNLRFLCPNCHSQTETWGKMKKKSTRMKTIKCSNLDCTNMMRVRSKQCSLCAAKVNSNKTIINWPSDAELIILIKNNSMLSLAKKLGVSDNAIRKRVKHRKLLI